MNVENTTWLLSVIGLDLLVAVIAIFALRLIFGLVSGVNTTDELSKKDNFAFGIAFAGAALALAQVVAASVAGVPEDSLVSEATNIALYSVVGMVLFKLGALINDYVIFNRVSVKEEIANQNISIGIVQAANYLALGFIISSAINWVEIETWQGLSYVLLVFFAMQIVLLMVTRIRTLVYSRRHDGEQLQSALKAGNPALAIRYAGHLIAVSIGISGVATLITYYPSEPYISALEWLIYAIVISLFIGLLAFIARKIVLSGIDIVEEVDDQQNIGVAAIEASIFMSIALILQPLFFMIEPILE